MISRKRAISISAFHFSPFYSNIQHHKRKSVIWEFIIFNFNGDDKVFIGISRHIVDKVFIGISRLGRIWTYSQQKCRSGFNKTFLKLVINHSLYKSYFTLLYFCIITKGIHIFIQNNRTCKRLEYFQLSSGF